tara:strand:- start:974 stop:1438 length:465 start_codon:yes stop_codon:yes gene_type:complete
MLQKPDVTKSKISNVKFGKNVKIVEPVNLYNCEIGDDCFIGPFVEIQKGAIIGRNTRIQSHSFICELVNIGSNVVIYHGVFFTNDRLKNGKPAFGDKNLWEKTTIGDNVYIGSGSVLLPVSICNNVTIGAGSVVTKDISKQGKYFGNPASFYSK